MTNFLRAPASLIASSVFALCMSYAASVTSAAADEVMLVNVKTGKCLTIAGGTLSDNNLEAVQFDCDNHPSRRWTLHTSGGATKIKNVKTGKCLTIAGGTLSDNNLEAVQFDCDSHPSRTWTFEDITGNGHNHIRNVKTNKCLTIAGGTLSDNNITAVQFDCDSDPSRTWTIKRSVPID